MLHTGPLIDHGPSVQLGHPWVQHSQVACKDAEAIGASQHISVSQTDSLMEFFLGALPSISQSPALPSVHFVSLYCFELKSHGHRGDSAVTSVTFPPVPPVNHALCGCKGSREGVTGGGSYAEP